MKTDFDPMVYDDLLFEMLLSIVDHPEDLKIDMDDTGDEKVLVISCHDDDRGRVIGKNGSTMQALRTLFWCIARKDKGKIRVEVVNPRSANPVRPAVPGAGGGDVELRERSGTGDRGLLRGQGVHADREG
jgi:predicted RNA-binding protein YlqC (UPF0109 family)